MLICELVIAATLLAGQQHQMQPGMHFDQMAAVHHFLIETGGGTITLDAKDTADDATRASIREHLKMIAGDFARGDFSSPFATHGEVPPGAKEMARLKTDIHYAYEETAGGGRVVIRTDRPEAVAAIHQFLGYQIKEHKTGDPIPRR
jgi:hypothetical protein